MKWYLPIAERLWAKIEKRGPDECWLWTAGLTSDGYGSIGTGHGVVTARAHRVVYQLTLGAIPAGMCVCHRCDVRACCNPAHLFLGTNRDNTLDRNLKGRAPSQKGESNGNAKLTSQQIAEIRAAEGRQVDIARLYGISQTHVSTIRLGKCWSEASRP